LGFDVAKRQVQKLDAATVSSIREPGRYGDGAGLYLLVDANGSKRWVFLFRWEGKLKEMGLGGLGAVGQAEAVSLAKARVKAAAARSQLADGINPIEARKATREIPTFGAVADDLIKTLSRQWRNDKHKAGWVMTLTTHAAPIRNKRVDTITTDDVLGILKPLADTIPETASRLRGRIERVLDAAKAKGFRTGENPARWRGHLEHHLPKRQKLSRGHHAAMAFADVPNFVARLRERDAMAALALEFALLTAARTGETLGARWSEFDLKAKVWIVPAERMKAGREHRVPLCERAVAILEKAAGKAAGGSNRAPHAFVFPGPRKRGSLIDRPLSTNAFRALLIRMGETVTAHGFRSSFRDWAGEIAGFQSELAEAALAHTVGDATERAYRRGDALDKRRRLMDAWAGYVARGSGARNNVTPIRAGVAG
jgi:integrase